MNSNGGVVSVAPRSSHQLPSNHHGRQSSIVLLDERRLDLFIEPSLKGGQLLDLIASHCNIKEREYFGLAVADESGHYTWLQLDRRVLDHDLPSKPAQLTVHFLVKFFIESISHLMDDQTIEMFFLQAKSLIFRGTLEVEADVVFQLAALALQAHHGDYIDELLTRNMVKKSPLLPVHVLKQHALGMCEDCVIRNYQAMAGQTRGQAIVNYMSIVESMPTYGVHYFEVHDKRNVGWWLGLSCRGIAQYRYEDRKTPLRVFPWNQLENLYFRDKKFSIEVHDSASSQLASSKHSFQSASSLPGVNNINVSSSSSLYEDALKFSNLSKSRNESDKDLINALTESSKVDGGTNTISRRPSTLSHSERILVFVWFGKTQGLTKCIWQSAISQHQFYLDRKQAKMRQTQPPRSLNDIARCLTHSTSSLLSSSADSMTNLTPNSDPKSQEQQHKQRLMRRSSESLTLLSSSTKNSSSSGGSSLTNSGSSSNNLGGSYVSHNQHSNNNNNKNGRSLKPSSAISSSSSSSLPAANTAINDKLCSKPIQYEFEIASPPSPCSGSVKTDKSVVANGSIPTSSSSVVSASDTKEARDEIMTALKMRKTTLSAKLAEREKQLKELCVKEAELTGSIPVEMPLAPGEALPHIRKRVGTEFTLSENLLKKTHSPEEALVASLELEYEIQSKITAAAEKIASDGSAPKSVRKQRKASYHQSQQKLREIESKLNALKYFGTKHKQQRFSNGNGFPPHQGGSSAQNDPHIMVFQSSSSSRSSIDSSSQGGNQHHRSMTRGRSEPHLADTPPSVHHLNKPSNPPSLRHSVQHRSTNQNQHNNNRLSSVSSTDQPLPDHHLQHMALNSSSDDRTSCPSSPNKKRGGGGTSKHEVMDHHGQIQTSGSSSVVDNGSVTLLRKNRMTQSSSSCSSSPSSTRTELRLTSHHPQQWPSLHQAATLGVTPLSSALQQQQQNGSGSVGNDHPPAGRHVQRSTSGLPAVKCKYDVQPEVPLKDDGQYNCPHQRASRVFTDDDCGDENDGGVAATKRPNSERRSIIDLPLEVLAARSASRTGGGGASFTNNKTGFHQSNHRRQSSHITPSGIGGGGFMPPGSDKPMSFNPYPSLERSLKPSHRSMVNTTSAALHNTQQQNHNPRNHHHHMMMASEFSNMKFGSGPLMSEVGLPSAPKSRLNIDNSHTGGLRPINGFEHHKTPFEHQLSPRSNQQLLPGQVYPETSIPPQRNSASFVVTSPPPPLMPKRSSQINPSTVQHHQHNNNVPSTAAPPSVEDDSPLVDRKSKPINPPSLRGSVSPPPPLPPAPPAKTRQKLIHHTSNGELIQAPPPSSSLTTRNEFSKPFEMADCYKYSEKLRAQFSGNGLIRSMVNKLEENNNNDDNVENSENLKDRNSADTTDTACKPATLV